MSVTLSIYGGVGWQFFDNNGNPLSGGKLYTYTAGTTTPAVTYMTSAGNVAHTNPIIFTSAGKVPEGEIWLTAATKYKFVLETAENVLLNTYDNVGGNFNVSPLRVNFAGTGLQVAFTMPVAPTDENSMQLYVNGVYQFKNTFSIAGTTLTFSEAPPFNSLIEIMYV